MLPNPMAASDIRRGSAASHLLGLRVPISPGARMSVVSVARCEVEVTAKS